MQILGAGLPHSIEQPHAIRTRSRYNQHVHSICRASGNRPAADRLAIYASRQTKQHKSMHLLHWRRSVSCDWFPSNACIKWPHLLTHPLDFLLPCASTRLGWHWMRVIEVETSMERNAFVSDIALRLCHLIQEPYARPTRLKSS